MEKVVIISDYENFVKKICYLRFLSIFRIKISVGYKKAIYETSKEKHPEEIDMVLNIVDILNVHHKKDKYSLIYDYACDYLDNEFQKNNWCCFKNNMCECNRNKPKEYQTSSCCTRTSTRKDCKYLDEEKKRCSIRCLACKLFVCNYLRKKGIKYTANKVPYLKYFLSPRQKLISNYSFFKPKEEIIKSWRRFYKLP